MVWKITYWTEIKLYYCSCFIIKLYWHCSIQTQFCNLDINIWYYNCDSKLWYSNSYLVKGKLLFSWGGKQETEEKNYTDQPLLEVKLFTVKEVIFSKLRVTSLINATDKQFCCYHPTDPHTSPPKVYKSHEVNKTTNTKISPISCKTKKKKKFKKNLVCHNFNFWWSNIVFSDIVTLRGESFCFSF